MPATPTTLVFTVAVNGYHLLYRRNLVSQQHYAQRHGYHYVAVTRPMYSALGLEVAWLKLYLARHALQSGYQQLLFVDADAKIRSRCPPLSNVVTEQHSIYAARGYSDRINSGVLLLRRSAASLQFLDRVIAAQGQALPSADDVGWGENGHIIHALHSEKAFCELPSSWNNNHNPELSDYIRHYSAGPLRPLFRAPWHDRLLFNTLKAANALRRRADRQRPSASPAEQLRTLSRQILSHHPLLNAPQAQE